MDGDARNNLAQAIRGARGERSQRRFAKDLGVSYVTIQLWERGEVIPDLGNLEAIATSRGQTLEQLLAEIRGQAPEVTHKPKVAEDVIPTARQLSKKECVRLIKLLVDEVSGGFQS
ncbi:MAG: helix-turn-helix domain-containing protein [Brasilonema octagenarum HA4186-MV1]|nr:helix-turn-helix transcriptional regulator [Brasilonema octagenarum]MBP5978000.1 helix-turn-helix transcriptional regulator [Brasilonema sp. CT11]MBW4628716.1 helix-turn-helix domain-containing protein [Brasilonema octagenarum HA4186-MV1]